MKVDDVRKEFSRKLISNDTVPDRDGKPMLELIGVSFEADEASIFGEPNEDYIRREIEWYRSMSRNVNDIPGGPPTIWKQVATPEGLINSNYGWCIWSRENHNQFQRCVEALHADRFTRQAIMIYTRPTMHTDSRAGGMRDFMCTNTVQYLIRDDKLHVVVNMRSNDAVYGYKNDYAWAKYVQRAVAYQVEADIGTIAWQVGSLHVYPRHMHLVEEYLVGKNED